MESKKEISVEKKEDGTTVTTEKSGNVTTTTITNKDGKQIGFSIMLIGQGNANFAEQVTKEVLADNFTKIQEPKTQEFKIEDLEKAITIIPSTNNPKSTKNHFKKIKNKRTKHNLFYKNDNENTL